jgi:hypothetical protein
MAVDGLLKGRGWTPPPVGAGAGREGTFVPKGIKVVAEPMRRLTLDKEKDEAGGGEEGQSGDEEARWGVEPIPSVTA